MTSKASSILIPGIICMGIGFSLFNVLGAEFGLIYNMIGAAFGLVIGFAMGEQFYRRHELEKQVSELQADEKDEV
ncbi:hypothetical protein [Halostagnicola kamekurae]|uniref:Uncharacterized protein n=1 Tax=Halostagnicola kamekurae TaxID=619731 RepID=A0A1I6Q2K9_9EURY|nr:hypothetical protein [Halostagnicola kamekurae]SFS46575.1 hypothetical protein SAMN04488556_0934 [Halostagnicola kamekurae]